MEVFYASHRLAALLDSTRELTRAYGPENARTIRSRLDSLRFAASLAVMPTLPGRFEELRGDRAGTFSLRLKHGYRLIFEVRDPEAARRPDGALDWSLVRAVTIVEIVDYHD